jgi:hypothetical protein
MHPPVLQKKNCLNINAVQIQDNPSGLNTNIPSSVNFSDHKNLERNTIQHTANYLLCRIMRVFLEPRKC